MNTVLKSAGKLGQARRRRFDYEDNYGNESELSENIIPFLVGFILLMIVVFILLNVFAW